MLGLLLSSLPIEKALSDESGLGSNVIGAIKAKVGLLTLSARMQFYGILPHARLLLDR